MTNTPTYIYHELQRRDIPVELIYEKAILMRYYHREKWHLLRGCLTEEASMISCSICDNKVMSELFARDVGMSVPASIRYESDESAVAFMRRHGSIVVKPLSAAHGHGISLNVRSRTALKKAIALVRHYTSTPAILQQMVYGSDLRILIIGGKYVAAVRRVPAAVVGDGVHTIKQLIEIENSRPHRSSGKRGELKIINLAAATHHLNKRITSIPQQDEYVPVVGVGNTSMGGHAEDATDDIPTEIREKAEVFVRALQLPVCGVDVMLESSGQYHFIEANARPGFGPHHHPRIGQRRNVTERFVDYLLQ